MQVLNNWLKGNRSFATGVVIYNSIGSNAALKNLLAMGETPFAAQLLAKELEAIASGKTRFPIAQINPETESMPKGDDEILKSLQTDWRERYQRMNLLRHRLDKFGSENTEEAIAYRLPIAAEIKTIEQECIAIWKKRDYYLEHNKLPFERDETFVKPSDPLELLMLIQNTKKYIRRYRKLSQDYPGDVKYAALYLKYKKQHLDVTGTEYEEKN